MSIVALTEQFHLLFLEHLGHKVDKNLFVLKGGCNLRFYFQSVRLSEDMDLDVHKIHPNTLKKNVNQILESRSLAHALTTRGLRIERHSAPKQTETTQRWKIQLKREGSGEVIPTKVEFSRRSLDLGVTFEPVNQRVTASYKMRPLLLNHYDKNTALLQKVMALAKRAEPQARDLFDIDHLTTYEAKIPLGAVDPDALNQASEHATHLSINDFKSQVVAYLEPEYQDYYSSTEVFQKMQDRVIDLLTELGNASE